MKEARETILIFLSVAAIMAIVNIATGSPPFSQSYFTGLLYIAIALAGILAYRWWRSKSNKRSSGR